MKKHHDPQAIIAAFRLMVAAGNVIELRALEATLKGDRFPCTLVGYFDDAEKFAAAVALIQSAVGIYITLNPVDPALLARSANRIRKARKGESTQDHHIVRRVWLLIDCDAVRPSGISATDAEHEAAIERCRAIYAVLKACGWPDPIAADSGNGGHLLYMIELPTGDDGLVQRCLAALGQRFDDAVVKVDQTVFNPARISKLYGTLACKGDDTPERPHRMSRILSEPAQLRLVPIELLQSLAAEASSPQTKLATLPARRFERGKPYDVEGFVRRHLPEAEGPEPYSGSLGSGRRWTMQVCPWNSAHNNGAAFIIQFDNGAISAGCHHNGCAGKEWADLRAMFDPPLPMKRGAKDSGRDERVASVGVPVLVRLCDVQPQPVRWLWPGRIALGKVTLIAGDPGLGKSFLTLDLAARVSTGRGWPDAPHATSDPGGVVLLSAEDDIGDTIRPRLDAAGADVSRVTAISAIRFSDPETGVAIERAITLADLPALEQAILATPDCRLVVVDPISAFCGRADSHKNAEVRALLGPLAAMAAKLSVAIVAVTHLRKGEGPAVYRAMGSLAFIAAARAAWAVSRDTDDPQSLRRLFTPIKNNIGNDQSGLAYRLEPAQNGTASVVWEEGTVTISADDALAPPKRKPGPEPEARDDAKEWLRGRLANGPVAKETIAVEAAEREISDGTLRRAKGELHVVAFRPHNPGPWWWRLPERAPAQQSPSQGTCASGAPGEKPAENERSETLSEAGAQDVPETGGAREEIDL